MPDRILIVGPNPAWQRVMVFDRFSPGAVNRASAVHFFASGKGINAARACRNWGKTGAAVVQFRGGDNGRGLLAYLRAEGIEHFDVRTFAATRCCTTCVDASGGMTELIEPCGAFTDGELGRFMARVHRLMTDADGIIVCGTAPGGRNEEFFSALAATLKGCRVPLLLDGFSGVESLLASGLVSALKINRQELETLAGTCGDPAEQLADVREKYALPTAAVTDGPAAVFLAAPGGMWSFEPPRLERVVNPLGSGDTCAAVFWSEMLAGTPPETAMKRGLAAAAANCLSMICGDFSRSAAEELEARVAVRKI
ncbi:MAG: 1-phosphofructokinase family hexose kinase [Victivallaceae bacterium]|nr:PfkB family carbohydrate kinase [Victivallaceae bacterium]